MVEYAATRWNRAPEIMLGFADYVSLPQLINNIQMLTFWNV